MDGEELEKTINKITKIMNDMGDINMFCDSRSKTVYQKKLHKCVDELYSLRKHLEFMETKEEQDEESKRKVQKLLGL